MKACVCTFFWDLTRLSYIEKTSAFSSARKKKPVDIFSGARRWWGPYESFGQPLLSHVRVGCRVVRRFKLQSSNRSLSLLGQVCGCMKQLMPVVSTFRDTGGKTPPHVSSGFMTERASTLEALSREGPPSVASGLAMCPQHRSSPPGAPKRAVSPRGQWPVDFNCQHRNRRVSKFLGF